MSTSSLFSGKTGASLQTISAVLLLVGFFAAAYARASTYGITAFLVSVWLLGSIAAVVAWRIWGRLRSERSGASSRWFVDLGLTYLH